MEKEIKAKKKLSLPVKIVLGVLGAYLIFSILAFIFGEEEVEPEPDENTVIGKITIENIVNNNITVVNVGGISVELTEATVEDEKKIEDSNEKAVLASGKTKDGNSFVGRGNEVVVTNGKDKVKGTVKSKGASMDPAKVAAVVSTSLQPKSYDEKTKDFTTKQAIYFAETADCIVHYPAQLMLAEKSDKLLRFVDRKSNSEMYVRFTELDSKDASKAKEKNTKTVKEDYIIESQSAIGNGYLVETVLYYPDKYSYVYDVLKKLIRTEFMEQNTYSYKENVTYGPNTELQSIYYPSYDCSITVPLEFTEIRNEESVIYFKDYIRDHQITLTFSELPNETNVDNIFSIFNVVAEDNAVWLTESTVIWHNGSGVYMGAANNSIAALLEIEGADTYDSFADSIMYWDITFTDNTMYDTYADELRESIKEDLLAEISAFFAEFGGFYEPNDYFDYADDIADMGDIGDMGEIGDIGDMADMSDPGVLEHELEDYQGDPGDEDIEAYAYKEDYDIMVEDSGSLIHKIHFDNMKEAHDAFDGEIGRVAFYDESGKETDRYISNINYLLNHGFGIVFEDVDEWDNNVLFMVNDDNIAVWARYSEGWREIVFFKYDDEPIKGREKGKLYFSYKLKQAFLNDILPNMDDMDAFINDVNNLHISLHNYWIHADVDFRDYYRYFYEIDRRPDGGLQAEVYMEDENLTYVGTYAMVDYDLYSVSDDGSMTFVY